MKGMLTRVGIDLQISLLIFLYFAFIYDSKLVFWASESDTIDTNEPRIAEDDMSGMVSIFEAYKETHGRDPPKGFDNWIRFAKRKNCFLDQRYYKQIYEDLDPWMHGRHIKEDYEKYVRPGGLQDSFTVVSFNADKGLFYQDKDIPSILTYVAHLLEYDFKLIASDRDWPRSIPADNNTERYRSWADAWRDNSCIRNMEETVLESHGFFLGPDTNIPPVNDIAPIFSQAKHPCFKDIMLPNSYHYRNAKYGPVNDQIHWEQKKNVLFWRGSSSGGGYKVGKPWKSYHRTRLLEWEKQWAKAHPNSVFDAGEFSDSLKELDTIYDQINPKILVDIGLFDFRQTDSETKKILESTYTLKKFVHFHKIMNFKYLLVVDGNTWPDRIQLYMQTNSVILYSGIFVDYYLAILEPWFHYVPVRVDLTDLDEKIEWLLANDDKARIIAQNAKAIVSKLGNSQHMMCYTGLLLQEYGRLFNQ